MLASLYRLSIKWWPGYLGSSARAYVECPNVVDIGTTSSISFSLSPFPSLPVARFPNLSRKRFNSKMIFCVLIHVYTVGSEYDLSVFSTGEF